MAEKARRLPEVLTRKNGNVVTIVSFGKEVATDSGSNSAPPDTSTGTLIQLADRRKNRYPKPPQPPGGSAA